MNARQWAVIVAAALLMVVLVLVLVTPAQEANACQPEIVAWTFTTVDRTSVPVPTFATGCER